MGYPLHRYCHTLLIGAALGAIWGIAAYPMRNFFKKIMRIFYIPYKTSLFKMVISGVLGIWLHVFIDGIYHTDVMIFWPSKNMWFQRTLHEHITRTKLETVCMLFFIATFILYILLVTVFRRNWVKDYRWFLHVLSNCLIMLANLIRSVKTYSIILERCLCRKQLQNK